jgi:hypothetical protein
MATDPKLVTCSRCLAPLPVGDPGSVLTCAYCGQQTRVPIEGWAAIPGLSVHVVGSNLSLEERKATTRATNQGLINEERRLAIRIAIPIVIVAVAAALFALLSR